MIIDTFKDNIFIELYQYNKDIIESCKQINFKENQWWFNPNKYKEFFMFIRNKDIIHRIDKLQNAEKYNLILHPANYLALLLINIIYSEKQILIEDVCCGMGNLVFYLSKFGYNNFSLVDDFSQIPKYYLETLMITGSINYISTTPAAIYTKAIFPETNPTIINMVGYHTYPKKLKDFSKQTELVCLEANDELLNSFGKFLLKNDFIELCEDFNHISVAYCRTALYDNFLAKLKTYEVIDK